MLFLSRLMALVLLVATVVVERYEAFSPWPSTMVRHRPLRFGPVVSDSPFGSISKRTKASTVLFSEPKKRKSTNEIIGIDRGLYLIAIVIFFNIWIFSIPPEFRRAKLCSEEQVIQYPESGCITGAKWASGVREYYANGGGISFDFSIDPKSQPKWMGGEQPVQK
jgi:hypothetical protein